MRGRPAKHPAARQGHRPKAPLQLLAKGQRPPACPRREARGGVMEPLSAGARARWREIWRSRPAAAWDRQADLPALTRYILMYDGWLRMEAQAVRSPLVRGSQGQARANPLGAEVRKAHAALLAVEDRFGLQPRGRIALGLALSEGLATIEDLLGPIEDMDEFALPDDADLIEGEFEVSG